MEHGTDIMGRVLKPRSDGSSGMEELFKTLAFDMIPETRSDVQRQRGYLLVKNIHPLNLFPLMWEQKGFYRMNDSFPAF